MSEWQGCQKCFSRGMRRRRGKISGCKACEGRGVVKKGGEKIQDAEEGGGGGGIQAFVPSRRPRVAVVGGGIAGCALALALEQRNIPCVVLERDESFDQRCQGYGLTMQQGASTLRKLGFLDLKKYGVASLSHASLLPDGTVVSEYGRSIHSTTREAGGNGKGANQRFNIQLPRQELRRMLYNALKPGTVKWGCNFESYSITTSEREGKKVEKEVGKEADKKGEKEENIHNTKKEENVHNTTSYITTRYFSSSTGKEEQIHSDILVGADGIWSKVRKQKLGDIAPRYLGLIVILGRAPCDHKLTNGRVFQTLGGETRIYTMPFVPGITMWQLSFPLPLEEAQKLSRDGPKALLQEALKRCGTWHDPVPEIIRNTKETDVSGYPAYDRKPPSIDDNTGYIECTDSSSSGKVVLIGDAMHPMSPFKAAGANQAILDAWSFAQFLAGLPPTEDPFKTFDKEMCNRVRSKVENSAKAAIELHSSKAIEIRSSRLTT